MNGAIQLLREFVLQKKVLWLLCRRHIYERHITHLVQAITGKTKAPRKDLYQRYKRSWPENHKSVNDQCNTDNIKACRLNWNLMWPDSVFFELANDTKLFLTTLLSRGIIGNNRTEYRRMVKFAVFYLGGKVENFYFHQPPPCHEARFMADAIYLLMLHPLAVRGGGGGGPSPPPLSQKVV